jgi:hypothetical protein
MSVLQITIAVLPLLLSLVSRNIDVIAFCLLTSILTVLLSVEPHRAVMAWCLGTLVAAVAVRERLRVL